jgi:hypothetical protein
VALLHVEPRTTRTGRAPRSARPATPYRVLSRWLNTRTGHREINRAESTDGRWEFERTDHETTLWAATYRPTGQSTGHVYGSLRGACEATAGGLLAEFRTAAFAAALITPTVQGHRWLGVHARIAAGAEAEADYRCTCGGLLFVATSQEQLAHLDACDECYTHGTGGVDECDQRDGHRFCATPVPAACAHGCGSPASPNNGASCGLAGASDCCSACCHEE